MMPACLVAPDAFWKNSRSHLCLDFRAWPYTANIDHLAGEKPERWSPLLNMVADPDDQVRALGMTFAATKPSGV